MTTTRLPGAVNDGPADAPRSRRRAVIAAGVAVLVAAVVAWLVAFSSVLGVKTVTVRGASTVSADAVRAAAHIASGTPLIRLDSAGVVRRVEQLASVASASVRTAYPNTVVITVVERVTVGYVETGSAFALVDRTGDQFRTVSVRPRGVPLFALPTGPDARPTGQAVASVASALPASLRAKVASIEAFDPTAITLLLTDHRVVRWGSADNNAEKAQLLPTLLTQPGTQFNITDPSQVVAH
jgi:cell division protein FtsQ